MSVCPVLSLTLVYCGQTVGWIQMKLGRQVGLGPGHIVLDGDPSPTLTKGNGAQPPIFGPCLLWPNGWMDQDARQRSDSIARTVLQTVAQKRRLEHNKHSI